VCVCGKEREEGRVLRLGGKDGDEKGTKRGVEIETRDKVVREFQRKM
jgi:hypothetical protein